ncbi:hypothetical protein [Chitinimonas sp.]|uniref:hypothetical protein n=1 Tax=Chitinimonas sp. TaxID=1934313 RepID=UPI002F94B6DD
MRTTRSLALFGAISWLCVGAAFADIADNTSPLSAQSNCCESLNEYVFSPLLADKPTLLAISPDSAQMGFGGELVGFAGVKVDAAENRKVEVRSYAMTHGIHIPNLIFIDSQFQPIKAFTGVNQWETMVENTGKSAIRLRVAVPKGAAYLVAYTNQANASQTLRMSSQGDFETISRTRCGFSTYSQDIECNTVSRPDSGKIFRFSVHGAMYGVLRFSLV